MAEGPECGSYGLLRGSGTGAGTVATWQGAPSRLHSGRGGTTAISRYPEHTGGSPRWRPGCGGFFPQMDAAGAVPSPGAGTGLSAQ
jgi:hypothetical protein